MNNWINTKKNYILWLSENKIKNFFFKKVIYDKLSLWWLTKLVDRDNIIENSWYYDLNDIINKKKIKKKKISYIKYFLGFLKNLIFKLFFSFVIKLFLKNDIKSYKKRNCLYVTQPNLIEINNNFIDNQYGKLNFKRKNNIYFIELKENFETILSIFKIKKKLSKIPLDYTIINGSVSYYKIISIYLKVFSKLFWIIPFLKNNYFRINGRDCSFVLKDQLIKSFFGSIQEQILKGENLLIKTKNFDIRNFITYYEFFPGSRAIYYFIKKTKIKNTISLNHGNTSNNDLFFVFNKNEFSKKNDFINFSPKPDYFTCKGQIYYKKLLFFFDKNKILKIGSLKTELHENFNNYTLQKNRKLKKIFFICGLNDYMPFIKHFNNFKQIKNSITILPHFACREETLKNFNSFFKHNYSIGKIFKKKNFFKKNDLIIFGDSSLGLELAIKGYNILRLFHKDYAPTFDITYDIPTSGNFNFLKKFLNGYKEKYSRHKIIENYFFKFDQKSSDRLNNYLKKL